MDVYLINFLLLFFITFFFSVCFLCCGHLTLHHRHQNLFPRWNFVQLNSKYRLVLQDWQKLPIWQIFHLNLFIENIVTFHKKTYQILEVMNCIHPSIRPLFSAILSQFKVPIPVITGWDALDIWPVCCNLGLPLTLTCVYYDWWKKLEHLEKLFSFTKPCSVTEPCCGAASIPSYAESSLV